jgi:hypothetical protein
MGKEKLTQNGGEVDLKKKRKIRKRKWWRKGLEKEKKRIRSIGSLPAKLRT